MVLLPKLVAARLHKRSLVDTGCLINTTKTENENNIALSIWYTRGKYDPSNRYTETYRNRNIIKLNKTFTKEKPNKNKLLKLYQYIHTISKIIYKNKNKIKNSFKYKFKTNLSKTR